MDVIIVIVGLIILGFGILNLKKILYGKLILETDCEVEEITFSIDSDGEYSIWIKNCSYIFLPYDKYEIVIEKIPSMEIIMLYYPLLKGRIFGIGGSRNELYNFSASKGDYIVKLEKRAKNTKFPIEIREDKSFLFKVACFIIITVGMFLIMYGNNKDLLFN